MNCPACGELLSFVPGPGYALGVETYQCPACIVAGVKASPLFMDLEKSPTEEYRRHATPEQLRELVESCPADVPSLQAVLSLLWSHHCWAVRLLIKGEANPPSLVALAIARSDAAAAIRFVVEKGGES